MTACSKPGSKSSSSEGPASRYLYVSSGACHSGGSLAVYTAATASNQVFRIDTSTGVKESTLVNYTVGAVQPGDSPVSIAKGDSSHIYVLVENATTSLRRIEKVQKKFDGDRSIAYFANGTTGLNQFRDLSLTSNNDFLITRNNAIEKISSSAARLTSGTAAFVSLPASGPCAVPSTGTMSRGLSLPNGMIAYTNVGLGTLSRVGVVNANGYSAPASCLGSLQSPAAAMGLPTSLAFDSANSILLVAFAGFSPSASHKVNTIFAYPVNSTTGAFSAAPTRIYDQSELTFPTFLYGISSMALDESTGHLYVSSSRDSAATSTGHFIEKFQYTPGNITGTLATNVLTRVGSTPFYEFSIDTKCISGMFVDE